jgi:flagellar FliJ protein
VQTLSATHQGTKRTVTLEEARMNRLFRLGPVLRARKAQEDAARGSVIQSRAEIREAQQLVKRRQLDLAGADAPTEGTARAMVASMVARQSLAAGLSGAHQMVTDAEEITREKVAELADAAKRRRAVEMMAERHADTVRKHDLATDQSSLDELAVTSKARNAARGVDALTEQRANPLRTGSGTAADREAVSRVTANALAAERGIIDLADAAQAIAARRADIATVRHPLVSIADGAEERADGAEGGADSAQEGADRAEGGADGAQEGADGAHEIDADASGTEGAKQIVDEAENENESTDDDGNGSRA